MRDSVPRPYPLTHTLPQGDESQDMMIVIEGKVKCITMLEDDETALLSRQGDQANKGRETRILSMGECLNDMNMLRIWDHAVESARALTATDIYILTDLDFHKTFSGEKKCVVHVLAHASPVPF